MSSPQRLVCTGHRLFRKRLDSEILAGEEGGEKPSPGPLGSGAAPGPRVELSRSTGKGLGRSTCEDRIERRRTLSCRVCVADKVGPIPRTSQVTLSRGSLDVPDSRDPIPDFRSSGPSKSKLGFLPGLQIPGTGPPAGLRISRSLRRFPVPTGFLISRSLDPSPLAPALS